MSDQRINLAELRENLDHSDLECEGECVAMFARATVLALVEAVEAAHAVMAQPHFHWENPETLALLDAVVRFEIGGES